MIYNLQHVALAVPDLEAGRAFYEKMGLEGRAHDDGLMFRCDGRDQDQVRLIPGTRRRLAYVSFGAASADLKTVQGDLERRGVKPVDAPVKVNDDGLWFHDPDGDLINVRAAPDAMQYKPGVLINNPGDFKRRGRRGAPNRAVEAKPRRLGHILKFSHDVPRAIAFYTEALGMKLSDRIGDVVAFLRFGLDSDHHTLALAKGDGPGLHHMSFEMGNVDQIQFCAQRMIDAGYQDAWGIGRHIYGSNYFHYIRDPWNGLVEYFWDIDFIPAGAAWDVENAEPGPDSLYQWAVTPPPADFLHNYEVR